MHNAKHYARNNAKHKHAAEQTKQWTMQWIITNNKSNNTLQPKKMHNERHYGSNNEEVMQGIMPEINTLQRNKSTMRTNIEAITLEMMQ